MGDLNILGIVAISTTVVTLLFACLACGLNLWVTFEEGTVKIMSGIFEYCSELGSLKTCTSLNEDTVADELLTDIRAVRAMVLLGILLSAAAIVCGVLVLFVMSSKKIILFVAGGLDIAAGLFLMIGFAVFAGEIKPLYETSNYGASFALDIVAWILAWVAGGLFIAAKMMAKE